MIKKNWDDLKSCKKKSSHIIYLLFDLRLITEESTKKYFWKFFESKGIARTYGLPYSPNTNSVGIK